MLSDQNFRRYQRQVMLPEIGEGGQSKLLKARVLVVGCGGLGSAVALQLAGSGVGNLVLCDFDEVELSNLHRQLSYRESDVGCSKTLALQAQIGSLNSGIKTRCVNRKMDLTSLSIEAQLADLVIDCSDNFPTRQQINRACLTTGTPLVSGAAVGWNGQLTYFNYRPNSPCYHCLYPIDEDMPQTQCRDGGVAGPNVNMIGSLQALLALKVLVGDGDDYSGQLTVFNGREFTFDKFTYSKDESCSVCSNKEK
jgi:sulfur carrier protein ThiS adenylyltransferase